MQATEAASSETEEGLNSRKPSGVIDILVDQILTSGPSDFFPGLLDWTAVQQEVFAVGVLTK